MSKSALLLMQVFTFVTPRRISWIAWAKLQPARRTLCLEREGRPLVLDFYHCYSARKTVILFFIFDPKWANPVIIISLNLIGYNPRLWIGRLSFPTQTLGGSIKVTLSFLYISEINI